MSTSAPYVGLDYFLEEDAGLFFGRDAERKRILGNLRASRLTLLYAESGVGKSSLLRAGVSARLRQLAARSVAEQGSARYVPVVFSAWQDDSKADLIAALETAVRPLLHDDAQLALRRDALEGAIEDAVAAVDATPLIILDQFEERFVYETDDDGFDDELARCINRRDLRANFLISVREDAYSLIGPRFKSRIANVYANYLHLDFLDERAAREAVLEPVNAFNRRLPADAPHVEVETALVDAVLEQVRRGRVTIGDGAAPAVAGDGDGRVETAYLQLVMKRLWDEETAAGSRQLRLETLRRLGGADTIVHGHLDDAMDELPADQRAASAAALRFLVTSSGRKIALSSEELREFSRVATAPLEPALEHLERERILRPVPSSEAGGVARHELYHDVLAPAILEWRKNYERERETEALAERMEKDERRRVEEERTRHAEQVNRIVRFSALALALLTAALAVAVVLAWRQQRIARSQGVAASAVSQLETDPELGLLLAREAWQLHESPAADQALRLALGASMVRVRITGDEAVAAPRGRALATIQDDEVKLWTDDGRPLGAPLRPGGAVTAVAFDRRGDVVAAAGDDGATVRRLDPGAAAIALAPHEHLKAIAVSGDGRLVATASAAGTSVLDAASGRRIAHADGLAAGALAFHPRDPGVLAAADCDRGEVRLWRWRTGSPRVLTAPGGQGSNPALAAAGCLVAFSPDGGRLAAAPRSAAIAVWGTETERLRRSIPVDPTGVMALDWSPDGRRLVAAAGQRAVVVAARTGAEAFRLQGHGDSVVAVDFSADGRWIVTGSLDGTARAWDAAAGTLQAELRGHSAVVTSAAFIGGAQRVLTASDDGTARVWELDTGSALRSPDRVIEADYGPDGRQIATAAVDGTARVWTATGAQHVDVQVGEIVATLTVEFTGADRVLVGGVDAAGRGRVAIADSRTGRLIATLRTRTDAVVDIDVSPSGRQIVVTPYSGAPSVWDLRRRERLGTLRWGRGDYTGRAAFSADGELIATGGKRGAQVFDARTFERRGEILAGAGTVAGASFSPAGDRLVTYGSDRTGRVWSWPDRRPVVDLRGHQMWITDAVFSADGQRIATASADRTVRIWRADSGELLAVRPLHAGIVNSVRFSPNGRTTLSASDDRTARISACDTCASTDDLLELAAQRVTRPITDAERRDFLDQ